MPAAFWHALQSFLHVKHSLTMRTVLDASGIGSEARWLRADEDAMQ